MDQLFIDRDDFFRLYEIPRMNSYIVERMKDVPKTAFSLVTISNDHLLISSFKKSEGDEAVILRLYNPTSQPLKKIQITLGFEAALIYACNLGEKNLNEIDRKSSRFTIESVKGNTAVTFKLYMKEKTIC
jgi:alpha-mannosidase